MSSNFSSLNPKLVLRRSEIEMIEFPAQVALTRSHEHPLEAAAGKPNLSAKQKPNITGASRPPSTWPDDGPTPTNLRWRSEWSQDQLYGTSPIHWLVLPPELHCLAQSACEEYV